ncbi:hypothetical protein O181_027127 [Austropuccinia psidii MF-1]|uniref:Etoposide-induced protein 2.4 n=1 Tax=Austropuccinia psidii MF-1 TaxID=1389203 RepID=A0A9Q3CS02_9BASI|nr:hypothetical protein [Austropuccinia psidii MF-1]
MRRHHPSPSEHLHSISSNLAQANQIHHPTNHPATHRNQSDHRKHRTSHRSHSISFLNSIVLHLDYFTKGVVDSCRWRVLKGVIETNHPLKILIIKNSLVQLIFLASIILFERFFSISHLSLEKSKRFQLFRILFNVIWLCPISFVSFIWSGFINDHLINIPQHQHHLNHFKSHLNLRYPLLIKIYQNLISKLNQNLTQILILLNYVVLSKLLLILPVFGPTLAFIFCSIANSFYCFEQLWARKGKQFIDRIDCLETRWSYHIGFGSLITLITFWSSDLFINLSLFTLFFPFLVILSSSNCIQPLPHHSIKSTSFINSSQVDIHQDHHHILHSHWIPTRLPIFYLPKKIYQCFLLTNHNQHHFIQQNLENLEDGQKILINQSQPIDSYPFHYHDSQVSNFEILKNHKMNSTHILHHHNQSSPHQTVPNLVALKNYKKSNYLSLDFFFCLNKQSFCKFLNSGFFLRFVSILFCSS